MFSPTYAPKKLYQNPHLGKHYTEYFPEPITAAAAPPAMPKPRRRHLSKLLPYLIFTLLLWAVFACLWTDTAYAAQPTNVFIEQNGQRTHALVLECSYGTNGEGEELPFLPIKTLSEVANVPIGWQQVGKYGIVLWGREANTPIMITNQSYLFTSGGATQGSTLPLSKQSTKEAPRMVNDSFAIPLSYLSYLGMEYRWDAASKTVTVVLAPYGYHTTDTTKLWQQTKNQINDVLFPEPSQPSNQTVPRKRLAQSITYFNPNNTDRTTNLYLSTKAIHGKTLQPGEEFSFNKTVGQRTPERGYKKAIVFENKEEVLGYGGGICQVSSTLYQSVIKVGLSVKERHSHSLPVSYATPENDATVAWGSKDLRFVNNLNVPVYLTGSLKGSRLTIEIWQGTPPNPLPAVR